MGHLQSSTAEDIIEGLERVFGPGFEVISNRIIEETQTKASTIHLESLRGNSILEGKSFILISAKTVREICRLLESVDEEVLKAVGRETDVFGNGIEALCIEWKG